MSTGYESVKKQVKMAENFVYKRLEITYYFYFLCIVPIILETQSDAFFDTDVTSQLVYYVTNSKRMQHEP